MRLVSVTLNNYRIHKDTTVSFDPALTLIGGPNESGKSTIIEAIHRALFVRSRQSGTVHASMQSEFHPGHPAVTLVFESGGETYTLTKQFTGTANAPTTLARPGQPIERGEAAEATIHRLLKTESVGGGRGLEERLPMQWSHLWVWQGAAGSDPLRRAKTDTMVRLRQRLGTIEGSGILVSPLDADTAKTISAKYAAMTREDGTPRKDSPLAVATADLTAAVAEESAAESALSTLHAAASQVEAADATIADCETSLATTRQQLGSVREQIEEASRLALGHVQLQGRVNDAARELQALELADREIIECERIIRETRERLTPATDRLTAARENEQTATRRFDTAMRQVNESQTQQAALAAQVTLLSLCEQFERLRADRKGLAERCDAIATLRDELADLRARLADLPTITADDLAALTALERRHDGAMATLAAIATRVELLAADRPVTLAGQEFAAGASETISAEAELVVDHAVRIRIAPGGGTSLIEATRRRDEARLDLDRRLSELGIESVDRAREVQPQRQSLEADMRGKETAIRDLGGDAAAEELQQRDREIERLNLRITELSPGDFTRPMGLDAAVAARAASDDAHLVFASEATTVRAELEAAERLRAAAAEDVRNAEDSLRSHDEEVRTRTDRLHVLVGQHGSERAGTLDALRTTHRTAVDALEACQKRLDALQHESLERSRLRLERAIETILERQRNAQTTRTLALARLRQEGTTNPSDDLARARARRHLAETRREQASREARAIALLASLFAEKKREVESQFVGPLTKRATEYLRCMYGPEAQVAVEYRDESFRNLTVARPSFGNARLGFDSLSGGGREQVAAALRLAMAEILAAEHHGCLPIVFDDAFVNSDPVRTQSIHSMLDLAAARGLQVIVLTCNHHDYDSLGAPLVELARPEFAGVAPRRTDTAATRSARVADGADPSDDDDTPSSPGGTTADVTVTDELRQEFLTALTAAGGKTMNKRLREELAWDDAKYDAVRDDLIAAGRIAKVRGPGGGVRLVDIDDDAAP